MPKRFEKTKVFPTILVLLSFSFIIGTSVVESADYPTRPITLIIQLSFLSLGAPAGTPEPIRQKLEDVIKKAIQAPALKKEFEEKIYARLEYISGEEFRKFISEQFLFYKDSLKPLG
jgi:tripartite-type tricarboxylate transporter receptor subunit TctC